MPRSQNSIAINRAPIISHDKQVHLVYKTYKCIGKDYLPVCGNKLKNYILGLTLLYNYLIYPIVLAKTLAKYKYIHLSELKRRWNHFNLMKGQNLRDTVSHEKNECPNVQFNVTVHKVSWFPLILLNIAIFSSTNIVNRPTQLTSRMLLLLLQLCARRPPCFLFSRRHNFYQKL